ncbi:MAG: hypothetical protein Q9219_003461 [cf. Caloplaca sp. 3 TL-2023]
MLLRWNLPLLCLLPILIRCSPGGPSEEDIARQWARTPWNTQNDDNVCPDYRTCSRDGHKYWNTLRNTLAKTPPVDRSDGRPLFDSLYESEIIPLGNYGSGIRNDLQIHGLDWKKMTLWASTSKDPETGEVSFDAAYGNILDTANGVIIAIENNRNLDDHRKDPDSDPDDDDDDDDDNGDDGPSGHKGLPWSEIMYQTWQRAKVIEDGYFAEKKTGWPVPGADLSHFRYSIQHRIDNPQTQQIIKLAYGQMRYPLTGMGDTTWRKWTVEEPATRNWFYALLGTDNCKGTMWLLNDHAKEAGKKVVREIWTRWSGVYPDIWMNIAPAQPSDYLTLPTNDQ